MRDKKKFQVFSESSNSPDSELHGEEVAVAAATNLLIMAALTRSCLQALSEQSPMLAQQCNSAIQETVGHMQFASSVMGLNLIPSLFDLQKTWDFILTGSLKISSDEVGMSVELIDTEAEVLGRAMLFDLKGWDINAPHQ